jgi:hypothetical protein
MTRWRPAGTAFGGVEFRIEGLNVWDHKWISLQEYPIELPHPDFSNQKHRMWLCMIKTDTKVVKFAAGEVSANVYAFYVPVES